MRNPSQHKWPCRSSAMRVPSSLANRSTFTRKALSGDVHRLWADAPCPANQPADNVATTTTAVTGAEDNPIVARCRRAMIGLGLCALSVDDALFVAIGGGGWFRLGVVRACPPPSFSPKIGKEEGGGADNVTDRWPFPWWSSTCWSRWEETEKLKNCSDKRVHLGTAISFRPSPFALGHGIESRRAS